MTETPVNKTKTSIAERIFTYKGRNLPDPDPSMSTEKVKEHYSQAYAELTNAAIEGPENIGGRLHYKFNQAIGKKG